VKVAPESVRIGGSGCVNQPVGIRQAMTCKLPHEAPSVREE